jgi:hypothetical protein
MPFQQGNQEHKKRRRVTGGGRKSNKHLEAIQTATEIIKATLETDIHRLARHYAARTRKSDKVLIHAIDKLMPDEHASPDRAVNIQFVQYNHHPAQLPAEGVSVAVLESNGNGQAGRISLASPERQGQNGIKFSDFEDVP